jgi:hypothetical protein
MVDVGFVYRTSALGNIVLNPSGVLNEALVAVEQIDLSVVPGQSAILAADRWVLTRK